MHPNFPVDKFAESCDDRWAAELPIGWQIKRQESLVRTYYAVYDRSGPKWAFCSTYTDYEAALDRLRYEAASVFRPSATWQEQEDTLIYLDSSRLKTQSGYEMKLEPIEVEAE